MLKERPGLQTERLIRLLKGGDLKDDRLYISNGLVKLKFGIRKVYKELDDFYIPEINRVRKILEDKKLSRRFKEDYKNYLEENHYYYQELASIGKTIKGLNLFRDLYEVIDRKSVNFKPFAQSDKDVLFNARAIMINNDDEAMIINQIRAYLKLSKVVVALDDDHQLKLMTELFDRHEMAYTLIGIKDEIYPGLNIAVNKIGFGIELVDEKIVIISANELFKTRNIKKPKYFKYKNAKVLKDYQELNIGDYVVHDNHGIGQYLGIKTLEVQGFHKDYLYVAYAGDDTLYIPVEQFKMIRKYSSNEGKVPKINKLGGSQWQKTKAKARSKVDDIVLSKLLY